MKNRLLYLVGCLLLTISTIAQDNFRVYYSEPERDDSKRTNFEVIGKMGPNFVTYKNNRTVHSICVYDNEMKLVTRSQMEFIDENRFMNVDFIAYQDYFYAIYQYQRKNVVYCNVAKLDGMGKVISKPVELDSTHLGGLNSSADKVYTVISSDDKQRIMLLKINSQNPKNYVFTMLLFDNNMQLVDKSRADLAMEERSNNFTDFYLSNNSELIFAKFVRNGNSTESVTNVNLVTKYPDSLEFSVRPVDIGTKILDELRLKIDNSKRRAALTSFYYKQKRGSVEGLYALTWDMAKGEKIRDITYFFNDDLRAAAKGESGNKKTAFDDFYIKSIIVKRDGGYLLLAESLYSSSSGNSYNRWNNPYWGSPWSSPMDYYSYPYYSPYYMPWNRGGFPDYSSTRFFADNIMVLSFSNEGEMEWSNIIPKEQFDDQSDNSISYGLINTGGELHFLFNQMDKKVQILTDQSIAPDGKISRHPTIKNLDRGYEFMPRFAKQVSSKQMIIPCWYKNYLCFAKIDF
jgi:hypothetical protein